MYVTRSVVCVSVCLLGTQGCYAKTGDNRCCLGANSCEYMEPSIRWGSRVDESIYGLEGDNTAMRPFVKLHWILVLFISTAYCSVISSVSTDDF